MRNVHVIMVWWVGKCPVLEGFFSFFSCSLEEGGKYSAGSALD